MASLLSLSKLLRNRIADLDTTQDWVRGETGLSRRTLTGVLSGTQDYKVTTLLAVADSLGLDLVLLPKEAARGMGAREQSTEPRVVSAVDAALSRIGVGSSSEDRRGRK